MAVFVVDASVALAWCFEDEATSWTEEFLERLRQGDRIIVPAHWATEVANALLMGVRRKRIEPVQPQLLWTERGRLPIDTEPPNQRSRPLGVKTFLRWAKSMASHCTTQHT
jgi:predicted nucleic acid-binding protein